MRISKWLACAVAALLALSCYAHAAEQVLQHRRVQEILPRVFVEGKVSRGFKVSNKFLADLDGTELPYEISLKIGYVSLYSGRLGI